MKRATLALIVSLIARPSFCDDDPEAILKSSLDLLARTKRIFMRAVVTNDEITTTGQKLQRNHDMMIWIRRPDAMRIDLTADRFRRIVRYDGKALSVFDPDQKFYATAAAPATIDATMSMAREKLTLDLPLGYLFADDAYAKMNAAGRKGTYVGLHRVGGTLCHHLSFTQDNVDWQIWIAALGQNVPRKIVIDFKNRPGRPQYTATMSEWNIDASIDNRVFQFTPPADGQKIDFLPTARGAQ